KAEGADDIIVFAGGVIPRQDYDFLYEAGAEAIFGLGTRLGDSAWRVLEEIRKAIGGRKTKDGGQKVSGG
ncbi:MAG: hypothetical protein LBD06_04635, partial [Candidatus Accumulibacter sp.]|nr:hypothetical protein [Accumulibacter sp.]